MCVNSVLSPIPASSTCSDPLGKIFAKVHHSGPHTKKSAYFIPLKMYLFSPLGPSNAGKLSACVYNQRECELWRALLGQGC